MSTWRFLKSKYSSPSQALKNEFDPQVIEDNPMLKAALLQIEMAELVIDTIMTNAAMGDNDDE